MAPLISAVLALADLGNKSGVAGLCFNLVLAVWNLRLAITTTREACDGIMLGQVR
jgi:hypothetical protein